MKKIGIFIQLLLVYAVIGQTSDRLLLGVSNGNHSDGSVKLEWLVGEPFILFNYTEFGVMTEGFVQPEIVVKTLSIDAQQNNQFTVSPNPVFDRFTIKLDQVHSNSILILINDLMGKTAHSDLIPAGSFEKELDMSSFSEGVYAVRLISSVKSSLGHSMIIKIRD